ncbi:serine/threonine-protein kinase [Salix suchowensis]|nr:serine/threonine-protein kinase [Salix suchowensis]
MADELNQESDSQLQYPTDPNAYRIWKRLEVMLVPQFTKQHNHVTSLHPNVLSSRCSFVVDRYLWVVMPYMAAGSLQLIISSYFHDGLAEPVIAIILKETLKGLCYIHDQGQLHTDIKAGDILIDTDNGRIKLADRGISVSIYDLRNVVGSSPLSSSSRMRLSDVAGTPYWMAPEVIHDSDTGYSLKADIWSFGIAALELAHGRPPLPDLPPLKSLLTKIKKRFGFSNYHDEKHKKDFKNKKFSKEFKDMRPSADQLLEYSFFKNCRGLDFLFKKVFNGLPNVEETFKKVKASLQGTPSQITAGTDVEEEERPESSVGPGEQTRRISGWKLNEDEFNLVPVFSSDSEDEEVVKLVRFGGETIIPDTNIGFTESSIGSGDLQGSVEDHTGENMSGIEGIFEGFDRGTALEALMATKRSLDEQRRQVASMIVRFGGEADEEEQLRQRIENLMRELDLEKENNLRLKMELENITTLISGAHNDASAADNNDND